MRKNRKVIISIVIISVAGLLFFLVSKTIDKIRHKERIAQKIKTFPALSVIAIGHNDLADWKNAGNPTVIIFFNSGCEHCQYEVGSIAQALAAFKETNLLFISDESVEKITAFSRQYKLNDKPGVWWLKMEPEEVYNTFGNIGVPHIWIYNKEGKLIKEFKGETKVEAILQWL